jgi:hypothetical protein
MSTDNGQIDQIEIMPDLENEIVDDMQMPPPPKKGGCGCNQNKQMQTNPVENNTNWLRIGLIVGGIVLVYLLFNKKGKVEIPKVETPEV